MVKPYQTEKTDILIIGAGCAGMAAAAHSSGNGMKCILVSKGAYGRCGISAAGFNGFGGNFNQPGDSQESHFRDIVNSGKYLSDQDVAEVLAQNAGSVFRFCEELGVSFAKKKNGQYETSPAAGCQVPRLVSFSGGGKKLLQLLSRKIKVAEGKLVIKDDFFVTRLLVTEGRIAGAVGLDLKTGVITLIQCRAAILAGGGAGFLWPLSDCPPESVGDVFSLAYRAGVKLVNMEQQLHYPTVGIYPQTIKGLCASYEWIFDAEHPPRGGALYNNEQRIFYPLDRVGTRDEICHVIAREIDAGKGTREGGVYLDARKCSQARKEIIKKTMLSYKRLKYFGIDILQEPLQVAPAAHTSLGGVRITGSAGTSIQGLFACGECTGNVHGANRLSGHSFLDAFVFGREAARSAYQYAGESGQGCLPDSFAVADESERLLSFLKPHVEGASPPAAFKNKITSLMGKYLGPIRSGEGLQAAIDELALLKEEGASCLKAPAKRVYNLDWIACLEAGNMLDCAEMIARCALAREESRGTQFRSDYPLMDNKNPVEHTVVRLVDNKMVVYREAVNMIRYRPEKSVVPAFSFS